MSEDGKTYEYANERYQSPRDAAQYWASEIDDALKREERWRDDAQYAAEKYDGGSGNDEIRDAENAFNILHSNVETLVPALYNATPVPDCRPRNQRNDEIARSAGTLLEESIAFQIDNQDFDARILDAVYDREIAGRGTVRVNYNPIVVEEQITDEQTGEVIAFEETNLEFVPWDHFLVGPGVTWDQVPWVAFKHSMTREDLMEIIVEGEDDVEGLALVDSVPLEEEERDAEGAQHKGVWKRAEVWEIWDTDSRTVIYYAPCYEDSLLSVIPDPCQLRNFFPCPRPLQVKRRGVDRITPIVPYNVYKEQAEELNEISERIIVLTKALKWRGIRASEIDEMEQVAVAEDGEFIPSKGALMLMQAAGTDLNKAIWAMPIDMISMVLRELYQQRELCKQTIYEITGLSDIMRGASNAHETARAQSIKAQWGTMRLQKSQTDVQRFCRDIMEIMAEIMSNKFQPDSFKMMSGAEIDPQQLMLLQSDVQRHYRIDIETNSTIAGDVGRQQKAMTDFMMGTAQFMQSVVPGVKEQVIPPKAAAELFAAFAASFQLGRRVEDTLAEVVKQAENMPPPGQPSPEEQQMQQKMHQIAMEKEVSEIEENKAGAAKDMATAEKTKAEIGKTLAERDRTQIEAALKPLEFERADNVSQFPGEEF